MNFTEKLFIGILASFVLFSCNNESGEGDSGTLKEITITASFPELSLTKTTIENFNLAWSEGDIITVYSGITPYVFSTFYGGEVAEFKGKVPADTKKIVAYYPDDQVVPIVQTAVPDGIDIDSTPCSATGDLSVSKQLEFEPECAFIRFEIAGKDVKYVTVSADKAAVAESSASARLVSDNGRNLAPGTYYFIVNPLATKELKITLQREEYKTTKTLSNFSIEKGECRIITGTDYKDGWIDESADNGPDQFVFVQSADWEYNIKNIYNNFGTSEGKKVGVGEAAMFYIFERPLYTLLSELRSHLSLAKEYEIPILVELDPITFWDSVPQLWNWFDESKNGYDPNNRENVEWYGWSSDYAVKIGWLNWGTQLRLAPMANLFSPAYQAAVKERMTEFMTIVRDWYNELPGDKKYLLVGVKICGEFFFGGNNWYYPNGNDLYDKDPSEDPTYGLNSSIDPSWGVQQIGYASLKYSGIKTSGTITAADMVKMESAYIEWLADFCDDFGLPRNLLFAHSGCYNEHMSTCMNPRVCPSWSCYGSSARDPYNDSWVKKLSQETDAPYWAVSEWAIGQSASANTVKTYISNAFAHDKCRYLSIFENVTGDYSNGSGKNNNFINGIKALQDEKGNK